MNLKKVDGTCVVDWAAHNALVIIDELRKNDIDVNNSIAIASAILQFAAAQMGTDDFLRAVNLLSKLRFDHLDNGEKCPHGASLSNAEKIDIAKQVSAELHSILKGSE